MCGVPVDLSRITMPGLRARHARRPHRALAHRVSHAPPARRRVEFVLGAAATSPAWSTRRIAGTPQLLDQRAAHRRRRRLAGARRSTAGKLVAALARMARAVTAAACATRAEALGQRTPPAARARAGPLRGGDGRVSSRRFRRRAAMRYQSHRGGEPMAQDKQRRAGHRRHGRSGRGDLRQAGGAGLHGRHHVLAGQHQGAGVARGDEEAAATNSTPTRATWPTSIPAPLRRAGDEGRRPGRRAGQQRRHHPRHDLQEDGQGDWDAVIRTNLDSCFNMTKQVCDGMVERGWGRVINVSSVNGQKGAFGQTNYSAAKAGMHGFTKALALEVARKGVTVNTISPGYIGTKMVMAIPAGRAGLEDHPADPDGPPGQARGDRGAGRLSRLGRGGVRHRRQHRDQRRAAHVLTATRIKARRRADKKTPRHCYQG